MSHEFVAQPVVGLQPLGLQLSVAARLLLQIQQVLALLLGAPAGRRVVEQPQPAEVLPLRADRHDLHIEPGPRP